MTKTNVQSIPSNSQHHDTPNNKTNREQTVLLSHTHYIIFMNLLDEYYGLMKTEILRSITEQFSETNLNDVPFLRIAVLPLIIIFIVQKN